MKKNIKERVVLYNVNEEEKNLIKNIFLELNIDVNLIKAEDEEDVISSNLVSFIKLPNNEEKRKELEDIYISALRGWKLFYIIDDNFYKNIEEIKKQIKEYHDDYMRKNKKDSLNNVKDGIIGFAIGDALGVPAEFKTREELKKFPITDMIGYGTYGVPLGTWSDDTSMTLATMDSIIEKRKIDTDDIANKFLQWFRNSKYTATEQVFDIGRTTLQSLAKYEINMDEAKKCGQTGEMDNGNGSLMRMLPIAYYSYFKKFSDYPEKDYYESIYNYIKDISSITHANEISILGCYIFVMFAIEIIQGKLKDLSYEYIKNLDYSFFSREAIKKYDKILKGNIKEELVENIRTTGYIVDTLEAVFWLFLNSKDYDETLLKAVNLGGDTDTIAAITGGLLGMHYGIEKINENWKKKLIKCEYIEKLSDQFYNTLYN